jgi:hypothetical protein
MADKNATDSVPLTVHLPVDLAQRLQAAAAARNRPASALVIDLLERSLPRSQPDKPQKGKIPYT